MATDQKQPLAGGGDYATIHFPLHHHPPPKPASKCFFYTFAIFVLVCILVFVFSLVVLRPAPLVLRLSSLSLLSLRSDSHSPSFRALLSARLALHNPDFGPLRLRHATLTLLHRNATAGSSDAFHKKKKKKLVVVGARGEGVVVLEVAAERTSSEWGEGVLAEEERSRVREELNSGVLRFKGVVSVSGELVLLKKIVKKEVGMLECDISIDFRSQRLLSYACQRRLVH